MEGVSPPPSLHSPPFLSLPLRPVAFSSSSDPLRRTQVLMVAPTAFTFNQQVTDLLYPPVGHRLLPVLSECMMNSPAMLYPLQAAQDNYFMHSIDESSGSKGMPPPLPSQPLFPAPPCAPSPSATSPVQFFIHATCFPSSAHNLLPNPQPSSPTSRHRLPSPSLLCVVPCSTPFQSPRLTGTCSLPFSYAAGLQGIRRPPPPAYRGEATALLPWPPPCSASPPHCILLSLLRKTPSSTANTPLRPASPTSPPSHRLFTSMSLASKSPGIASRG